MTFSGLFAIGVSGVSAFATGIEAVSSNIANSQTAGYKRVRSDFADLIAASGPEVKGAGVEAIARQLVSEQGSIARTSAATNLAVAGAGLLVVAPNALLSGEPFLFTRSGDFAADASGDLVNGAGYVLQGYLVDENGVAASSGFGAMTAVNINRTPPGVPPQGALIGVEIDEKGRVIASYASGEKRALYQLPLALFVNADGLERATATAFRPTQASGAASLSRPFEGRAGSLEGGALEISTVDMGREFAALIEIQRAYSSNARVIAAADSLFKTLVETAA